ncbi:MAG: peptide ABC transporter substrate-binding protein, partial [Pseudomonadota bacterium]
MKSLRIMAGATALVALAPMATWADGHLTRGGSGHLNIIYWQAPSTLNPFLSGGTKEVESASLVLESLARFDDTGEITPWLAAEIPTVENGGISEDLTTITWSLREGVLWSDGTPFTAADAVFTWEYCTHPEGGCAQTQYFEGVTSVEALDDLTVQITFDAPTPFPYTALVGSESPIIQAAQFADCLGARAPECTEANFGPIGTGPFVVTDFRPNDVIEFVANENFRFEDRPHFASITFKGGGDATASARSVLETAEFDYAWNLQIDPTVLAEMEAQGNGTVVTAFGTSVERIMINQTNPDPELGELRATVEGGPHPFLTNQTVTEAMSMAIDRALLVEIGYGAGGRPTCNVLPAPALYASTANDGCLVQDIEGANAMLDEAGIVDTDGDGVR